MLELGWSTLSGWRRASEGGFWFRTLSCNISFGWLCLLAGRWRLGWLIKFELRWGHEMNKDTSPIETGLMPFVRWTHLKILLIMQDIFLYMTSELNYQRRYYLAPINKQHFPQNEEKDGVYREGRVGQAFARACAVDHRLPEVDVFMFNCLIVNLLS